MCPLGYRNSEIKTTLSLDSSHKNCRIIYNLVCRILTGIAPHSRSDATQTKDLIDKSLGVR